MAAGIIGEGRGVGRALGDVRLVGDDILRRLLPPDIAVDDIGGTLLLSPDSQFFPFDKEVMGIPPTSV